MSSFKARGIIIKEVVVGDNDKSLLILFKDYGKLNVWARNSRSVKSKLLAGSTLFTYADFVITKSKNNLFITQIDIIEKFYDLSKNLDKFATANYLLELTQKNIEDNLEINDIMLILLNSLNALNKTNNLQVKLICRIYELKFLELNGYSPVLSSCIICNININYNYTYFGSNGCICNNCKNKINNLNTGGLNNELIKINKNTLSVINHILVSPLDKLFKFGVSNNILKELEKINIIMLENNLNTSPNKLKSKNFLDGLDKI